MRLAKCLVAAAVLTQTLTSSPAQSTLFRFDAGPTFSFFGHSVASAGDLDGDGFGDVLVGALGLRRIHTQSGFDGSTLWTFTLQGADYGRTVAGLGDVDGDGVPDVIATRDYSTADPLPSPQVGAVHSGATGAILYALDGFSIPGQYHTVYLVRDLEPSPDINGDTIDDIILGLYWEAGGDEESIVQLRSGVDGSIFMQYVFPDSFAWVAATGDVDGDGRGDYLLNAEVRSGATHAVLYTLPGGGIVIGDMNGDGVSDLLGDGIRDGTSGAHLYAYPAIPGQAYDAGDQDGDGTPDLAFADPFGGQDRGEVRIHSGATGGLVGTFTGEFPGDSYGTSVAHGPDVNRDGRDDLIVGAPRNNPHQPVIPGGYARVETLATLPGAAITFLGSGCNYGPLVTTTPIQPGQPFTVVVTAPRVTPVVIAYGLPLTPGILIPNAVSSGCRLVVDPAGLFHATVMTDPNGDWSITATAPPVPALAGVAIALQAGYQQGPGWRVGEGLLVTIGY